MTADTPQPPAPAPHGLFAQLERLAMAVWTRVPLWAVAVVCGASTLGYVAGGAKDYLDFSSLGTRVTLPSGDHIRVPLTRILVDLTFVLMGLSFILRRPPKTRNTNVIQLSVAALGGVLPMLPFFFDSALASLAPSWRNTWRPLFMEPTLSWWRTLAGAVFLVVGNGLDVWAYSVLFRSFSVVPEARALVVRGPYRWVRHPVYVGQVLAQAGFWLFFATAHGGWVVFWLFFVGIQIYRARAEEKVLQAAFGQDYVDYAARVPLPWPLPAS